MVMEKVNREKEKAEHHLDLRRLAPPAFPHMKPPSVSQKKELGRGRPCWEPAGTLATPEAGREADDDGDRREAW